MTKTLVANCDHKGPRQLRVLLVSPDPVVAPWLQEQLADPCFAVIGSAPGLAFIEAVQRVRPEIAVLDRVSERTPAAEMEMTILKELCPNVLIIVVSEFQTSDDAWIVEQGVFFYTSVPPGPELVRVVKAAAARCGLSKSAESRS